MRFKQYIRIDSLAGKEGGVISNLKSSNRKVVSNLKQTTTGMRDLEKQEVIKFPAIEFDMKKTGDFRDFFLPENRWQNIFLQM